MGRRFKDMQTPEQQWSAQQAQRGNATSSQPVRPATHAEWRSMTVHQQAAHLARLDGREDEAREWERWEAEKTAPAAKRRRRWFR